MRLCRFNDGRLGLVEDDQIADVSAALEAIPLAPWPAPKGVGPVQLGNVMHFWVESIGAMDVPVRAA